MNPGRYGLIDCQRSHQLLSQRLDVPLPWLARLQLMLHLSVCTACGRVKRQFEALRQAMRQLDQ